MRTSSAGGRQRGGRQRGFTLIEILLATVLLAAGLALAFATLRAASVTVERGDDLAQRSERIRAAEGFLRRRLVSAQPIAFAADERTGAPVRFLGEARRMRFVADLPNYLGRGGPALHEIGVGRDDEGLRLQVAFATVLAGETVEEREPRPPEPLATGLSGVRFSYRGLNQDGRLTGWLDAWTASQQLPVQVRVEVESERDGAWPVLVVALPQGSGQVADGALQELAP
ncbi:prepilin-type N-terminal cleavage/methylation domain-containing protein [Luteimonas suaedae]|uniref:prepilin-type N-terminal cleavage/methylation domain-containing protein n=1 Tax=Luteimonas suaedae TaxID=2605430 RepID=UPI0011F02451|nr:prepilin-type N-terminal cleavage/methylation domain-containing protein [Luteimonas suaedae]